MANFLTDTTDFTAYMNDTDAGHKVRKASDYIQDVIDYFHSEEVCKAPKMPWKKTHANFAFRKGELTLWNGYNGHGKSLVLGQICVGFCRAGQKVMIASMEMKVGTTLSRMCRQEYKAKPEIESIREFHQWTDGLLWFYDQQGTVKADKMLAVARYAVDQIGVDHIVIDSLMKLGIGEDDYNSQKHIIDQLTALARDTNVHIHLVVHARKPDDESKMPGKYQIKGSGSISDQADNVLHVWRNKKKEADEKKGVFSSDPDLIVICDKQRHGEWEGSVHLWADKNTMSFREAEGF